MRTWEVRTSDALRQACENDALLVWAAQDFESGARAWRRGDAVAVASPFLSCRDRLAVRGPVRQVAALVRDVLPELGPTYRPIGDADLVGALPGQVPGLRLVRTLGWMETDSPACGAAVGKAAARSARACWLDDRQWSQVAELIQDAYPRSYARPGLAGVRRWAGSLDGDGRLAAVTADAWSTSGIGFLAGVVTRPSARRQGHGAAAFGLALDTLVAEHGRAGLMVAADNLAARAMYAGMGMRWRELGAACVLVTSSAA